MSLLVEKTSSYEQACKKLLIIEGVRFAGIINNRGRLVIGGFKAGVEPYENEQQRNMLFMEIALDLSMRQEFDESLGTILAITSKREKVNMTTIPLQGKLLLISSEPYVDIDEIETTAREIIYSQMMQNTPLELKYT
ncbi:MAG: DUF6659 family protein [Nitrosopumilaceae archaeon]